MAASSLRGIARVGGLGAGAALLTRAGDGLDAAGTGNSKKQQPASRRAPLLSGPTRCDGFFDEGSKDTAGFVGVFLDRPSVEKARSAIGAELGRAPHALVHLHPDPATRQTFAPLFGSKAQVLVRGVAEDTATKQRVMIVDVSVGATNGSGSGTGASRKVVPRTPLGHAAVPTIAFASESWDDEVADLLGVDLARRLLENGVLATRGSWDGVLPAQVIDGIKYPATHATFTQVEEPIALEGTVCASNDYDKRAGQCVATATATATARTGAGAEQGQKEGQRLVAVGEEEGGHGHGDGEAQEERGECPLCTYMMASPCKDVFVVFKACIDKAGDSNEAADLKECEPSAADVHACIHKFGLFQENEHQAGDDDDDEIDDGAEGTTAPSAGGSGSGSGGGVHAASPSK